VIAGLTEQIEKLTRELEELRKTHQIWKDGYKKWETNEEEWFDIQKKYDEQIKKLREDIQKLNDALAAAAAAKATAEAGAAAAAAACAAATSGARAEGEAEGEKKGEKKGNDAMYQRILTIIGGILKGDDIPGELPGGSGPENHLRPLLESIKGLRDKPAAPAGEAAAPAAAAAREARERIGRLLCFFTFFANFFIQLFFLYGDELVEQRLALYKEYNTLAKLIHTAVTGLMPGKPPAEVWLAIIDTLFYALYASETYLLLHKEPDGDEANTGLVLVTPVGDTETVKYITRMQIYKAIMDSLNQSIQARKRKAPTTADPVIQVMSSVIDGFKATIPNVYYVGRTVTMSQGANPNHGAFPISFFYQNDPAKQVTLDDFSEFKYLKVSENLVDSVKFDRAVIGTTYDNYIRDFNDGISFDHLFAMFIICIRGYLDAYSGELTLNKCNLPSIVQKDPNTVTVDDIRAVAPRRSGYGVSTESILTQPSTYEQPPAAIRFQSQDYNYNAYQQPASPPSTPRAGTASSMTVSSGKSGQVIMNPRRWPQNTKSAVLRNRAVAQRLGDTAKLQQTMEREAEIKKYAPSTWR
jgi:hypothetical protein